MTKTLNVGGQIAYIAVNNMRDRMLVMFTQVCLGPVQFHVKIGFRIILEKKLVEDGQVTKKPIQRTEDGG